MEGDNREKALLDYLNSCPLSSDLSEELHEVFNDYFDRQCYSESDFSSDSEGENDNDNENEQLNETLDIPIIDEPVEGMVMDVSLTDIVASLHGNITIDENDAALNLLEISSTNDEINPSDQTLDKEETIISDFTTKGCGCKQAHGKQCSDFFTDGDYKDIRAENRNLDYYEGHVNKLDLIVLGRFRVLCCTAGKTVGLKKAPSARQRLRTRFMMNGLEICEKTFLFCHTFSRERLKRLRKIFNECGVVEKMHGNTGSIPKHTFSFDVVKEVVAFIKNYAEQNALFLPGRQANQFNASVKLLPTSDTKVAIFSLYKESCNLTNNKAVSLCSFRKIWLQFCPDIIIQSPKSDLCKKCQANYTSLKQLGFASEMSKMKVIQEMSSHLNKVMEERKFYRESIEKTKSQQHDFTQTLQDPCSFHGSCHYSFDMAQQIFIPSNPLQPGPIYFLAPYKIGIFGVMCETKSQQQNYLIPEAVVVSKGANAVVSMLHHFFENHGNGETDMLLHADNCVAQNKNNILMSYLNWRVQKKLNHSIQISFLPVGHTKFSCDWAFGLFKKKFRVTAASSLDDVSKIVEDSTPVSKINCAVKTGTEKGEVLVPFFDWQGFFTGLGWKKISQISSYSHFTFSHNEMGFVQCSNDINNEGSKILIGMLPLENEFPSQLHPEGLTQARKKYLFEKIREYCTPETADILCPLHILSDNGDEDEPLAGPSEPLAGPSEPLAGPSEPPQKKKRGRPKKVN